MAEAAAGMNDLIERIDAADGQIDQAKGHLEEIIASFAPLFEGNVWDDEPDLPDLEGEFAEFAAAVQTAADEQAHELATLIEQGEHAIQESQAHVEQLATAWETAKDHAVERGTELKAGLGDALQQLVERFEQISQRAQEASDSLGTAEEALDKAFGEWEQAVSGEFTEKLEQRFTALIDQLSQDETQKVEQHLTDAQDQTGEAVQLLLDTGAQLITDLQRSIGDAIEQLGQHIEADVQAKLQEAVETIIETALQEIIASIAEAFVTSEMGVVITSAMSPVLPELIALKKATDGILAAIHLWKESIGKLTGGFM